MQLFNELGIIDYSIDYFRLIDNFCLIDCFRLIEISINRDINRFSDY